MARHQRLSAGLDLPTDREERAVVADELDRGGARGGGGGEIVGGWPEAARGDDDAVGRGEPMQRRDDAVDVVGDRDRFADRKSCAR